MSRGDLLTDLAQDLANRWGEAVEAAVFVHRSPEAGIGRGRLGRKDLAAQLRINNVLALTPTRLRLLSLGGRSGTKPKDDLAAWPRTEVRLAVQRVERSAYFASYGTTDVQQAYEVHLQAGGIELVVDVMAEAEWMDVTPNMARLLAAFGQGLPA